MKGGSRTFVCATSTFMKILTLKCLPLLLLLQANIGYCQNIVPNPSFENYTSCPTDIGQITRAAPWKSEHATSASTDYFNACNDTLAATPAADMGVPENLVGKQASSGKGYIGLMTFGWSVLPNYREYARVAIPALEIGAVYRVYLKVSLSDRCEYGTNGMGVLFYKLRNFAFVTLINAAPQIDYGFAGNITDTTNWVSLVDTFTADSSYTNMILGNFKNDATTLATPMKSGGWIPGNAYYYIDSVAVEKVADPSVSVKETLRQGLGLYPNPVHHTLHVSVSEGVNSVVITNAVGQVVMAPYSLPKRGKEALLEIAHLPAGVYFIRVNEVYVERFLKE